MSKTKQITLGEISVSALVFSMGDWRCVVGRESMDYIDFMQQYDQGPIHTHRVIGLNMDSTDTNFWAIWMDDYFDPPVVIIRADHEGNAEEIFVDELDWAHINEVDLPDYLSGDKKQQDSEYLNFNSKGQPYDSESIQCRQVKLVKVEIDL